MKKYLSAIFILLIFSLTITGLFGFTRNVALADGAFKSKSIYMIEANSKQEIIKNNEKERLPIASMCKIMTLLICFDHINTGDISVNETITVSKNAAGMGGSQVFLEENGEYLISDLLKSITVASANDACVAMAERICGDELTFVDLMNQKANELGMDNTIFVNCTGLPQPGQYSCASDVAIMFSELIKNKLYFDYSNIWMDKIEHSNGRYTEISNTNKLIKFYNGCDSGKTGYTSEAGHCLCASAERNGLRFICVVIKSPDSKTRFNEVSTMFNKGFSEYTSKCIIDSNKQLDLTVELIGGKKNIVKTVAEESFSIITRKNEQRAIELDFIPKKYVKAPIYKGEQVGVINFYENGNQIHSVNILADEDVMQKNYFDVITDISLNWGII